MYKVIITESQFKAIKKYIAEVIEPHEAYRDESSIDTLVHKRRNIGFLSLANNNLETLEYIKSKGLNLIPIKQDGHIGRTAYVMYNSGFEPRAQQLATIARRNGGYLPIKTPEETYIIGVLLGYNKNSVKDFVIQKFPNFTFY